jgi:hypothetical protein
LAGTTPKTHSPIAINVASPPAAAVLITIVIAGLLLPVGKRDGVRGV